jgi:hypothetical protein
LFSHFFNAVQHDTKETFDHCALISVIQCFEFCEFMLCKNVFRNLIHSLFFFRITNACRFFQMIRKELQVFAPYYSLQLVATRASSKALQAAEESQTTLLSEVQDAQVVSMTALAAAIVSKAALDANVCSKSALDAAIVSQAALDAATHAHSAIFRKAQEAVVIYHAATHAVKVANDALAAVILSHEAALVHATLEVPPAMVQRITTCTATEESDVESGFHTDSSCTEEGSETPPSMDMSEGEEIFMAKRSERRRVIVAEAKARRSARAIVRRSKRAKRNKLSNKF